MKKLIEKETASFLFLEREERDLWKESWKNGQVETRLSIMRIENLLFALNYVKSGHSEERTRSSCLLVQVWTCTNLHRPASTCIDDSVSLFFDATSVSRMYVMIKQKVNMQNYSLILLIVLIDPINKHIFFFTYFKFYQLKWKKKQCTHW